MSGVFCVSPEVNINALVEALCDPETTVQLTISPYLTNKVDQAPSRIDMFPC